MAEAYDVQRQATETVTSAPPHVDPRLIADFDYLKPTGFTPLGDIHESWKTLHAGPDVVWSPRHGGYWIFTRADDIAWAEATFQLFSHREITVPRDASISLPPITLDPPDTIPYRAVLTPSFTPKVVRDVYQPKIRALTIELIEQLKPRGACEFVNEFAFVMPVSIFLGIANLPLERREQFLAWGHGMAQHETRAQYAGVIGGYLNSVLDQRGPGDDLLGRIAAAREDASFTNKAEITNMAMLIFAGGLDTVAAEFSFAMRCLAKRPELQQRLRDDPAIIPAAVEEFLRRHGVSCTARLITRDIEHKGARLMAGEMVMVPSILAGLDERLYPNPMNVDFDRKTTPHATFGNGPHKCPGQYLARMEIQVFLEEWFSRMPEVRLNPDLPPLMEAGAVSKLTRLNLLWD
jgi:cytochrome P450